MIHFVPVNGFSTTNDTNTASHWTGNSAYNIIRCSMTNYHIGQCRTTIYQSNGRYANSFFLHNAIVLRSCFICKGSEFLCN